MKYLNFFSKVMVSVLIIWFVWDSFNFKDIGAMLNNPIVAVVPVCWFLNQVLTTLRLHAVFRAMHRSIDFWSVFRANFSSLFFGNMMPGVIGADVVKFFYLKKSDPFIPKSKLTLILGLDRILGLISVLFWCSFFGFFITIDAGAESSSITRVLKYMPIGFLIFMIVGLVFVDLMFNYISRKNIPLIVKSFLNSYSDLKKSGDTRSIGLVFFYNLLAVFILLVGLVLVGAQLQFQKNGHEMMALQFFLIPLVLMASMIPITPMGVGVAQITMAGAYELFGLDATVGVSVSTLSQLGLLCISILAGGTIFLIGKPDINFSKENIDTNL